MNNLISISDVRANLPNLVNKVSDHMDRVVITVNGQPKAILVSNEELDSLEETSEVLTIPQIKKSINMGLHQAKKGKGTALSNLK